MKIDFTFTSNLTILLDALIKVGGRPVAVGGYVRDFLLGQQPKDIDLEIYDLELAKLLETLKSVGQVDAIGKSFGVLKVTVANDKNEPETFDVSVPRKESKQGIGHKGFLVSPDPGLTFEQASLRRDFTINSMGFDFTSNTLLDPHGGKKDLQNKVLRHVSKAFGEDPLRVLRACQFAARFDLKIEKSTLMLCQSLKAELPNLAGERIFEEFKKLVLAEKPSIGLSLLLQTRAIVLFPELFALIGCPQEKKWHPEGDVWVHTLLVVDEAAKLTRQDSLDEQESLIIMLGALCHDLGKPIATRLEEGRIRSKNHEPLGEEPTRTFLQKIGAPKDLSDEIVKLVVDHLKPCQLFKVSSQVSNGAIRRLASRVSIKRLCKVAKADFFGRGTEDALSGYDPASEWLLEKAKNLSVEKKGPVPILLGRHLIEQGIKPGPQMGKILEKAFSAQLDGEFEDVENVVAWCRKTRLF